jgi:hypothetical protein
MSYLFRPRRLFPLFALIALVVVACSSSSTPAATPAGGAVPGPRIAVTETFFDFGKVPLDKAVSHTFELRNVGSQPLVLDGVPQVRAAQGC